MFMCTLVCVGCTPGVESLVLQAVCVTLVSDRTSVYSNQERVSAALHPSNVCISSRFTLNHSGICSGISFNLHFTVTNEAEFFFTFFFGLLRIPFSDGPEPVLAHFSLGLPGLVLILLVVYTLQISALVSECLCLCLFIKQSLDKTKTLNFTVFPCTRCLFIYD